MISYKVSLGTSLVVQWLRMCLPMQETQVSIPCPERLHLCDMTTAVCTLEPTRHNY